MVLAFFVPLLGNTGLLALLGMLVVVISLYYHGQARYLWRTGALSLPDEIDFGREIIPKMTSSTTSRT
ncbi:hypothetical protein JZU71_02260, partial [bacterium]|nr:hypothetical protein [bacterium]